MTQRRENDPPMQQPDNLDRPAEMDDLAFEKDQPSAPIGEPVTQDHIDLHQPPERTRRAGLTEGEIPGEGPTADDMTPETLIKENGARSPEEPGAGPAADKSLTEVAEGEIGGGTGLDEAELAQTEGPKSKRSET